MSGKLQSEARDERPDVEELKSLANSVEEFTTCLIDPLKSDKPSRESFGESLDTIIDEAIQNKQMKVKTQLKIMYAFIYRMLNKHPGRSFQIIDKARGAYMMGQDEH